MSRRYGRQQKRKARAKIAELEQQLVDSKCDTSIAKTIVQIAMQISPNSICFEPRHGDYYPEYAARPTLSCVRVCNGSMPEQVINIKHIDMFKLESALKDNDFDRMIHFRSGFTHPYSQNIEAGYSISREGLSFIPFDFIANEIATHIKANIQ